MSIEREDLYPATEQELRARVAYLEARLVKMGQERRELEQERDALAAHVERLDTLATRYLESSQETVELLRVAGGAPNIVALANELDAIANEIEALGTPETSLARLSAKKQAEAIVQIGCELYDAFGLPTNALQMVLDRVDAKRRAAEEPRP